MKYQEFKEHQGWLIEWCRGAKKGFPVRYLSRVMKIHQHEVIHIANVTKSLRINTGELNRHNNMEMFRPYKYRIEYVGP